MHLFQLAVSYTNKLYIWGASPQVLRLQAQTQKRNRIIEQRDSIAKQFENIDEFEKGADNAITNETNKENLESNAQNKNAQAKVAGGSADSQMRRQLDNACLKNVNVGSLEEAQTHLKPGVVDTSLVKGDIIQVSRIAFNCVQLLGKQDYHVIVISLLPAVHVKHSNALFATDIDRLSS